MVISAPFCGRYKCVQMAEMNDSTKPAAMAVPKEGFLRREDGRYGPIFPRTPACHGFTIIAKVIPGRGPVFYEYSRTIEKAVSILDQMQ